MELLKCELLPRPPVEEQLRIVRFIAETTSALAATLDTAHREIDLLREYRTRLIADVVTGKLDVREAAARLPDEVEEAEPFDEADALADADEVTGDDLDAAPDEADA